MRTCLHNVLLAQCASVQYKLVVLEHLHHAHEIYQNMKKTKIIEK